MRRSIWNGVITFGIVSIPVKMYSATESKDISFHLLHDKCDSRIKEQKWCPSCDEQVSWSELDKGFEYAKGKYVKLTSEDFEKLPLPSKHTIEIKAFVKAEEIDPIYYEKSYYLQPSKEGEKAFKLLSKVLEDKQLVAIGTVAIRRERLCSLRLMGSSLMLDTLLHADEIREDESSTSSAKITKAEMDMASSLVDMMVQPFKPEQYKDNYQSALKKLIDAKLKGREIEVPETPETGKVVDLMEALRASVENARGGSKTKQKEKTTTGSRTRASGNQRAPRKSGGSTRTKKKKAS
jgi:DNA end-binding protein Ku